MFYLSYVSGNGVTLQFKDFSLAQSDNCDKDYLEVKKGNASGELIGAFCGANLPNQITHNGSLWLFFESGELAEIDSVKGFLAEYTLSKLETQEDT